MSKNIRLLNLIKRLGLTQGGFGEKIGMHKSSVGRLVNGSEQAPYDFMGKVAKEFNVDPQWLSGLIGNDDEILYLPPQKNEAEIIDLNQEHMNLLRENIDLMRQYNLNKGNNFHWVPFISQEVYGSFYDLLIQEEFNINEKFLVWFDDGESPNDTQYVVQVKGKSMAPLIPEKSKILIEEISDGNINDINKGIYAIVYDHHFMVKEVKQNTLPKNGQLTVYSADGSEFMTLNRAQIRKMWKVLRIVDLKL